MCKSIFTPIFGLAFSFLFVVTGNTFGQADPPLNINQLILEGRVTADHTSFDIGTLGLVFDEDDSSLARSANINPLVITLTFQQEISITGSSIIKSYGEGNWKIEIADNLVDLEAANASYQQLFDREIATELPDVFLGITDTVSFDSTPARIIRLTLTKSTGDDFVHLNDWVLNVAFAENNATLCGDGIDNDGDGLIDCQDPDCANLSNNGCTSCGDGISFTDVLLEYDPGCALADPNPSGAVGVSDWYNSNAAEPLVVFLGQGGRLKLGFTNNRLTNSGNSDPDILVFEVGGLVEACDIALRPADQLTMDHLNQQNIPDANNDGFYEVGSISGNTSTLDIDAVLSGFTQHELQFDAVAVTDVVDGDCGGSTPGADIDAVCALSSVPFGSGFNDVCQDTDLQLNEDPVEAITYKTSQTITSSGTVASGSEVTFQAGQTITLSAGFVAENGSSFTARIDDCSPATLSDIPDMTQEETSFVTSNLIKEQAASSNQITWQVMPNPMQSQAIIKYDLPSESQVTLRILDLMGREVETILPSTVHSPGLHEVAFTSSSLSFGLYVVQFNMEGIVSQKKIIVSQ